ncbi:MAG: cardiolipin synthase [Ruminiclostridium sp.]|nr:cardiolipin synthase [Ruminiclostridium sp.]
MERPSLENGVMEMSLLEKGHKGLLKALFGRTGIIVLMLLIQIALLVVVYQRFSEYVPQLYTGMIVISVITVFYLLNRSIDPSAKITWLIIIAVVPIFGALLLIYTQMDVGHRTLKKAVARTIDSTRDSISQDPVIMAEITEDSPETAALAQYLSRSGCHPVFKNTHVTYFPSGADKLIELLNQLERAEKFIFLEYFIIDEGLMWGSILDILARKAKEGVEVRVMYDGSCEFSTLPHSYPKLLRDQGIQCKVFSPARPFLSTHYNYRDHRKILVIDGHTAFTGGINLADEYINHIHRFGHWKDTAVMLQGDAARSFTLMFLQLWNSYEKNPVYSKYLSAHTYPIAEANGYVIPYADCPLDDDKVGERVYMDILNRAQQYVHIMSPYLILDGELETALKFAAERGVDVSLILPGIPDKKIPYALAKTHYASLMASGVKIYEYTPGFVHAKVFVSDDCKAVVGTINLDYRSLYHHFECAAYLYKSDCIPTIEKDFQKTLAQCRPVTRETIRKEPLTRRVTGIVMKAIAPLM